MVLLMVHNGILTETIGISVMVSIGLLLFVFLAGSSLRHINGQHYNLYRY